jgi:hypothetical protein
MKPHSVRVTAQSSMPTAMVGVAGGPRCCELTIQMSCQPGTARKR